MHLGVLLFGFILWKYQCFLDLGNCPFPRLGKISAFIFYLLFIYIYYFLGKIAGSFRIFPRKNLGKFPRLGKISAIIFYYFIFIYLFIFIILYLFIYFYILFIYNKIFIIFYYFIFQLLY